MAHSERHIRFISIFFFAAMPALLLSSCQKEGAVTDRRLAVLPEMETLETKSAPDGTRTFVPANGAPLLEVRSEDMEPGLPTKGTVADFVHPSMHLWGFYSVDGWSADILPNYCMEDLHRDGDVWVSDSPHESMPSSYDMYFFAAAPADHAMMNYSGYLNEGYPRVVVNVPVEPEKQTDILVSDACSCRGLPDVVPLTFRHVLSGVRFETGAISDDYVITRIDFQNVWMQDTYTFDGTWAGNYSRDGICTITADQQVGPSTPRGTRIGTDSDVLFLIPQTLGRASVIIYYTVVSTGKKTGKEASFKQTGLTLEQGKMNTFTVNL